MELRPGRGGASNRGSWPVDALRKMMGVIALPNREFPPGAEALALAACTLQSLMELTPERLQQIAGGRKLTS